MKALFLAMAAIVALAPSATLKGRPATEAPAALQSGPTTVTVTLVRWPFT